MKSLLAKMATAKAIGLYIGDDEVAISQVAATAFGVVEVKGHRESAAPDQLKGVLERLLAPLVGRHKRLRVPVALGLPGLKVFFSTRPIQTTSSDPSPHVLLHEALQSSGVAIDEMAVDLIQSKPGRRRVASIVACPRKYLTGLLDTVQEFGMRLFRVEPAPCALLRAAVHRHRAPRGAKVVLRIFLGDTQALAVQAVADFPFVWRLFGLPRGDEASAILSTCRSLETLSKFCGVDSSPGAVMIHGRADLRNVLEFDWLQEEIAAPVQWTDGPALDNSAVALGLALGCLNESEKAFDLARSLKPRPSVWELVPWGEVALQASLLVCMGLFLGERSRSLNHSYQAVRAQNAEIAWAASPSEAQLETEKKDLEQKAAAVRKFLESRVIWTSYTRDIATRLPTNSVLTSFQGTCELGASGDKKGGNAKPKKSLVLRGAAPMADGGAMPPEIDEFLESLRGHPLLRRDFPVVELADLKQSPARSQAAPAASFSVVGQPRANKAAPKQSSDGTPKPEAK